MTVVGAPHNSNINMNTRMSYHTRRRYGGTTRFSSIISLLILLSLFGSIFENTQSGPGRGGQGGGVIIMVSGQTTTNTTLVDADCPIVSSYLRTVVGTAPECVCRVGYYINASYPNGTKDCRICDAGYYGPLENAASCLICPRGSQSRRSGESSCETCTANTFASSPGTILCSPCPTKSSTLGATGSTTCFCDTQMVESYVTINNTLTLSCQTCPNGAECSSTLGEAKAKAGWWYDSEESKQYWECPDKFCCDRHDGTGCRMTDDYRCYPHRTGFLCSECVSGYSSINGGDCIECSEPNAIVLIVMIILALVFITLCLMENPSEDASTKLIVDYLQMVFLILNPTLGINEILSIIHLEFGDATSHFSACILPLPPILGISASALIPFGLFLLLGLIHGLHWLLSHYGPQGRRETWTTWYESNRWRYTNCAWEIILFGFMAIVSSCVQLLDCQHVGLRNIVTLAPSIQCFTDEHFIVSIIALTLFCVFTFVVPIWLVSLLYELSHTTERRSSTFLHSMRQIKSLKKQYKKQKKELKKKFKMEEQRKKNKKKGDEDGGNEEENEDDGGNGGGVGNGGGLDQKIMDIDSYLALQMQQEKKVVRTGHEIALWCYRRDKYWCEAAFLLRRVLFTLITVLLTREKAAMIVIWFCLIILVFHARFPVFRKQSSGYFHDFALAAVAFQSVLNLDIYATDSTGHVDFGTTTNRAQVVIVYGITLMPIIIGLGLFFKELLKERIRKRHAIIKTSSSTSKDGEVNENGEPNSDEDDDDDDNDEADNEDGVENVDGSDPHARTVENSASSPRFRPQSPSFGGAASQLMQGVLAQGPNVSTRSYNNAPIDLDAVLASDIGAVISTPAFPNHHHPPVTIHF